MYNSNQTCNQYGLFLENAVNSSMLEGVVESAPEERARYALFADKWWFGQRRSGVQDHGFQFVIAVL